MNENNALYFIDIDQLHCVNKQELNIQLYYIDVNVIVIVRLNFWGIK